MSNITTKSNMTAATLMAALFGCAAWMSAHALDPANTVGPDECVDCHTPENDVWHGTTHYKTYDQLSLSDRAVEIAEALDLDDIEAPDGTCVDCHYTLVGDSADSVEPIAGISCESCHGAAADWIESHGKYPGEGPESESAEQKRDRIAAAERGGMIRPERINLIAANCLSCHTVPNEKLVNVGGHEAGSDFEFVAWTQGEVRHNVFWNGGESNAQASPERKRVFYVVGQATDLQFSLRALAKSSAPGDYRNAMMARVKRARAGLEAVNQKLDSPQIAKILSAADGLNLAQPEAAAINSTADRIGAAIGAFVAEQDGSGLGGLDSLISSEGRYSDKY